jgi:phytoene dehydrogenase-like protein
LNDLQLGIGNPSVIDSSVASPGCAALTLLRLLPEAEKECWFASDRRTYRQAKVQFAERLISAVATIIPALREHIHYLQIAAPPTFTRYLSSLNGSIYGSARGQWSPPIKTPVPGLMLVGGAVPTGPGIEAVVIAGTIAANLIVPAMPDVTTIPRS